MKLISLHISSFGKLKNVDLTFADGTNVLQQKNGFGKTTLANFIRAMFYGFKYVRAKHGNESLTDVALWLTWNSTEKIGGSLTLEHNGEQYRVERYFGQTAKAETLSVTNLKTGKPLPLQQSVGEYFLGLTAESFDRSAYYPQEAVEMQSNENFDARLAGMVQNSADYDEVQNSLRKYRKNLKFEKGNGGVIFDLEQQRSQILRKIYACEASEQRQREIDARLGEIAEERRAAREEITSLNGQIAAVQQSIGQLQPDGNAVEAQKLAQLAEKLQRVQGIEQDKLLLDELSLKIDSTPDVAKVQRPVSKPLLGIGAALLALGIGLCFVQIIVGLCLIGCGAVCTVCAFFVKHALTTLPAGEKDAYITQYFQIASKYVFCVEMDYKQVQKAVWQFYNDYTGDKRVFEALSQKAVSHSNAANGEQLHGKLLALQNRIANLQRTQEDLSGEESRLCEEGKRLDTNSIAAREQLAETESQIAEAKHKYEISLEVSRLLTEAKQNLSVSYLPKLCNRCSQLFSQLTQTNAEVVLDRDFSVSLHQNAVTKPLQHFSRGTREIALLCFRVALSELLYGGNIPLLIIDDAFVNFDEENFLRATQLLEQLSSNTQVLYFTCHNRLGYLAK